MIAGVQVKIDGQELAPEVAAQLLEVRIDDHLVLPDTFLIRVADPGLELVDAIDLEIGTEVELLFGSPEDNRLVSLLKGQIASVQPEFTRSGATITARGYDHSHALNRTKRSETYQNMTVGDIARRVASRAGMRPGTIDDAGGPQDFVQQNNETDWEFLWRLAQRVGNEVLVVDRTLHFRRAGGGADRPVTLRWGETLHELRPRLTGVQQVEEVVVRGWDAASKRVIEATARPDRLMASIGVERDSVVRALEGGSLTIADRPVATQQEADALARSVATRLANGFVEAEGVCEGDPRVTAGCRIAVEGVGRRFGGTYTVSATRHVFRGGRGYQTHFTVSGQAERSLVELLTPARRRGWGNSVVIGVVTNNEDPEGMGRVRVKYPELGDTEGYWARIASAGAGKDKGLLMTPVVGDEVVIGFEHDDVRRPYVLGAVWNGTEKPGELAQPDGSFALRSEKKMTVTVKEEITFTGDKELVFEIGQAKVTCKKDGTVRIEGKNITLTASNSISLEAPQGAIAVKAGVRGLTLSSAGGTVSVSGTQISLG